MAVSGSAAVLSSASQLKYRKERTVMGGKGGR